MADAAMPVIVVDDDVHDEEDDDIMQDDNNDNFQHIVVGGAGGADYYVPLCGHEESKHIPSMNGKICTYLDSIMVSHDFAGDESGKEYSRFCRGKDGSYADSLDSFFYSYGHRLTKYAVPLVMKFSQMLYPKNTSEFTSTVHVVPTSVSWKGPEANLVFLSAEGRPKHTCVLKKSLTKMTRNNMVGWGPQPFKSFEIRVKTKGEGETEEKEGHVCQLSFSYNPLPVPKKKSFGPVVDMLMAAEDLKDLVVRCSDGDVKTFQLLLKLHSGFYKTLNDNTKGWTRSEDNIDVEDGKKIMRRTRAYDTAAAWKLVTEWFCSHEVEDVDTTNVKAMAHAAIIAEVDLFVGLKPLLMSRLKAIVITIDNVVSIVEQLVPLTLDYDMVMDEDLSNCLFELLGKGIDFIQCNSVQLLGNPVFMQKYSSLLAENKKFAEFVETMTKDRRKRGKPSSSSSSSYKKKQRRGPA